MLRFEDIPLDLTDLRLMVRQTADVLRRFGALEEADYQKVQALGRDMKLLAVAGEWYRSAAEQSCRRGGRHRARGGTEAAGDAGDDRSGARAGDAAVPVAVRRGAAAAPGAGASGRTRTARCAAASRTSP